MRRASRSRALRRTTRRRSPRSCSRSVASRTRSASSWACTSARRRSITAMSPSSLATSAPRRATSPASPRSRARAWPARLRRSFSLCAPESAGASSAAATAASAAAVRASLQARVTGRRGPGARRSYQRLRAIPGGGLQPRARDCGRALPRPRRARAARRRAAGRRPRGGPRGAARGLRARPLLCGDLRLLQLQPRRAGRRRRPRRVRPRGARRGPPRPPRPRRRSAGRADRLLRRRHADAAAGRPARRDPRRDPRRIRTRRRRRGDGRVQPRDGRAGHAPRAPRGRLHADLARHAERARPRPRHARPPPHRRPRGRRRRAGARCRLRARLARPHLRHAGRERRRLGGVARGGAGAGGRGGLGARLARPHLRHAGRERGGLGGVARGGARGRRRPPPAYGLTVERGTRLHARVRAGTLRAPDDDAMARRYRTADALLAGAGLAWYEISNWAADAGARCRHNLAYWRSESWWGVGPGAHSHVGGGRWWNVLRPPAYAERLARGVSPAAGRERLTAAERRTERVMLGLRLAEGLALGDGDERAAAEDEAAVGRLDPDALARDGRAVLTLDGRLMSNAVARALVG